MDRPIPGFYYDKEKKRYFKIVGAGNAAPSSAAYNADTVKRRRLDEHEATRARKRHDDTKHLIRRAPVLRNPLTGAWLVREFGQVDPELPVASWASGLRDRGGIEFGQGPAITRMMVNGDDTRSGMGVVYAATTGDFIAASYIPTDHRDYINFLNNPQMRPSRFYSIRREHVYLDSMSSLNYHRPSRSVIMTDNNNRHPNLRNMANVLVAFEPKLASDDNDDMDVDHQDANDADTHHVLPPDPYHRPLGEDPEWLLGECDVYSTLGLPFTVNSVRAAPASHPDSWVLLATNQGLFELGADEFPPGRRGPQAIDMGGPRHDGQDVLSADFHPTNPHIVFAGRRDGTFLRIDRRMAQYTREGRHHDTGAGDTRFRMAHTTYRGPSSIAHIRALDEHQLLAAGPTSAMAVYDARWMKTVAEADREESTTTTTTTTTTSSSSSSNNTGGKRRGKDRAKQPPPPPRNHQGTNTTTTPVVRMYEYTNMAHLDIGLDVAMGVGGGATAGGIVAAGQDDGTVGLFSVRTGRRLAAGDVDRVRVPPTQAVARAVAFAAMPWERDPSLFVGVGSVVRKYSFATGEDDG